LATFQTKFWIPHSSGESFGFSNGGVMAVGLLDEMFPPGASGGEGSRLSKYLSGEAIETGK